MRQKKGFTLREVCGETVIVAEGLEVVNFNKLLSLNESAAFLWKQASALGDFTADQLVEKLCEEYDVSREQALQDVEQMLQEWQKIGIVE
ncbi:MAG: PqqD family protein [Prevotella sp.]|nr:PqqD family protein [Prevotella sp.]